jgi:hypothetical protein
MSSTELLNRLSSMLDAETQNQTLARGRCSKCQQAVLGKMVTAMDKQWHYEVRKS